MNMVVKHFKASPSFTMDFWSLFEFFKGRKKGIITVVGAAIASWLSISDLELINILIGLGFEMVISVIEFYFKKVLV